MPPGAPRPRVLLMVDHYLPGEKSGGPVRTVQSLLHHLQHAVDFYVLTRDRDFGERTPYAHIVRGSFTPLPGGRVRYLRRRELGPRSIVSLLRTTPHDVLYLNTLYSWPFSIFPLLAHRLDLCERKRIVLAPRGQLNPGALALKSTKKRIFLATVRRLGLYDGITWQASNAAEVAQIRERFGAEAKVQLAANLRLPAARVARPEQDQGRPRVVFLGRISPMKNLEAAIEIMSRVRCDADFDIYGPTEVAAYWQRCQEGLAALPANIRARYVGAIAHPEVHETLSRYDVMLLPTRGENHGHVIAEALAAGCRPLISDRTPWKDLAAHGAGWDLPLDDLDAFRDVIEGIAQEPHAVRAERADRAAAWLDNGFDEATRIAAHRSLFEPSDERQPATPHRASRRA